MSMMVRGRPPLSDEFRQARVRERILPGLATAITRSGYRATKIAEIVSTARVARGTFYDCFGGKEAASAALVADVFGFKAEDWAASPSLAVLMVEIAALERDREQHEVRRHGARWAIAEAERVIGTLAQCEIAKPPPTDDPRQQVLPPGRHSLPPDFVRENQVARLISGAASAIAEQGYEQTTVGAICRRASVSRRTLYEHFGSLDNLVVALVTASVSEEAIASLADAPRLDPQTGLGAVAIEVVAERVERGDSPRAELALSLLSMMAARVSD